MKKTRVHPRKPTANPKRYRGFIDFGLEANVWSFGKGLIHKIFRPKWIKKKYVMEGKLRWINTSSLKRFPPEAWEKITLLLANHSVDVLRTAKSLGIPAPKKFKAVCVKGKKGYYWVVEMSDLRKKGTVLLEGSDLHSFNRKNPIKNFQQLSKLMVEYREKMWKKGFYYADSHYSNGEWLIRINKKTGIGELFLVDATNFEAYYPQKPVQKKGKPNSH